MPCIKMPLLKKSVNFLITKIDLVKQTVSSKGLSTTKYLLSRKTSQLKASTLILIDRSTEIRRYLGIEKLGHFGFIIINLISRSCYKDAVLLSPIFCLPYFVQQWIQQNCNIIKQFGYFLEIHFSDMFSLDSQIYIKHMYPAVMTSVIVKFMFWLRLAVIASSLATAYPLLDFLVNFS